MVHYFKSGHRTTGSILFGFKIMHHQDLPIASLLHEYVDVTAQLPRDDDCLFITERVSKQHGGKFWGLSSDRLAVIMGKAMRAAGVLLYHSIPASMVLIYIPLDDYRMVWWRSPWYEVSY